MATVVFQGFYYWIIVTVFINVQALKTVCAYIAGERTAKTNWHWHLRPTLSFLLYWVITNHFQLKISKVLLWLLLWFRTLHILGMEVLRKFTINSGYVTENALISGNIVLYKRIWVFFPKDIFRKLWLLWLAFLYNAWR